MTQQGPDWAALYEEHKDAMWIAAASVLRVSGRESEAEDAVMAAMVSLMESPPTSPPRSWRALMITAAKRRALDRVRSAEARHHGGDAEDLKDEPEIGDFSEDVIDRLEVERQGALVWDALAVLEPRDRQIVWKRVALGRSRAEVAEEFDVSPGRINQVVARALKRLGAEPEIRDLGSDRW